MNIASLLNKLALVHRNVAALVDLQSGDSFTFGDLGQAVRQVGNNIERLKLPVGTKIALLGGSDAHDVQYLFCDYGIMGAARVRVPLDPGLSMAEQVAQLRDSEASALVCSPALRERADAIGREIDALLVTDSRSLCEKDFSPVSVSGRGSPEAPPSERLASLTYTGGTTGSPKAVMLTHGNLTCAVQNAVLARQMGVGDLMLNVRPVWPTAAILVLQHLAAGGTILMGGHFDPERFLRLIEQHRVAKTSLVPTQLVRLLNDTDPRRFDLSALRALDIGAAAIAPPVFLRALDAFGPRIGVNYGLTEAPSSCYQPPSALEGPESERKRRIRSVGRPLFGVEIVIRSSTGNPLKPDDEGEITIRGGHVAQGYWKRPDATHLAFRDGWFRTGDLGVVDEDGVLSVTGRLKEVIRTGGKSVLPSEVEESLLSHPAVREAAVIGLPDVEWGEVVVAAVVLRRDTAATEQELMEWCRGQLSGFKRPKHVRFIAELPRSHYGKIQRAKVLDLLTRAS